jgi:hypothetical protein
MPPPRLVNVAALFLSMVVAILVAGAAEASAARLPSAKQAKALEHAFARDSSHPRKAAIVNIRVSTVNPKWSLIKWMVPGGKARSAARQKTAKPKIINLGSSTYSGPPKQPKPAKHPPPAVEKDLGNDMRLVLTYTASGSENANWSANGDDGCGGTQNEMGSFSAPFSWTATWIINVDKPSYREFGPDGLALVDFPGKSGNPTLGRADESFSDTVSSSCGSGDITTTCSQRYDAVTSPHDFLFEPQGVFMPIPLAPGSGSCSDGRNPYNNYTARWQPTDAVAGIPLQIGNFGGFNVGPFDVSFPRSVPYADGPATSTTKGPCMTKGGCSDTLGWSGSVTIKVF